MPVRRFHGADFTMLFMIGSRNMPRHVCKQLRTLEVMMKSWKLCRNYSGMTNMRQADLLQGHWMQVCDLEMRIWWSWPGFVMKIRSIRLCIYLNYC